MSLRVCRKSPKIALLHCVYVISIGRMPMYSEDRFAKFSRYTVQVREVYKLVGLRARATKCIGVTCIRHME